MPVSDYVISFAADVIGVFLGAGLGYILGLQQQRKFDREKDDRLRRELRDALKNELVYVITELGILPPKSSEIFSTLAFDPVFLELPTFTSIVNSGQLLLLDTDLVSSLRELNTEIHEHNLAQTSFFVVGGTMNAEEFASHSPNLNKIAGGEKEEKANGRLEALLKVIVSRRKTIVTHAESLIKKLA